MWPKVGSRLAVRRGLRSSAGAAIATVVLASAAVVIGASPASADGASPIGFVPIAPVRLMDTRINLGTDGSTVLAQQVRELQVGGAAAIPPTAVAVSMNVTVADPAGAGFVTVWPSGAGQPLASNLNFIAGQTVANMVTVGLGTGGKVSLFNSSIAVELIVDITGWYASGFHPLVPARLVDTRDGTGGSAAPLGDAEARLVKVGGQGGVSPTAVAVALNVTVTEPTASGYLTAWPAGAAQPVASNVNFVPGQTVPNMVTVGLGTAGQVALFNSVGATHVVVDVAGWFDGGFHPVQPARIMDTRAGTCLTRLGPGETRLVAVAGQGGVPATASAVALNVTATNATAPTFVTLWPSNQPKPESSNVNLIAGTVPNMVTVGLGADGRVALFNNRGSVDVVVDVTGWYDGASAVVTPAPACDANGFAPQPAMRNELSISAHDALVAVRPGATSPAVTAVQNRLFELGFWLPDTDGGYGYVTTQAVMAFQKSIGIPATGVVDGLTALLVSMQTIKPVGQSTTGDLVEVDKGRQLWHLIRDGKTVMTVNTSTGSDVPYTEVDQKNGGETSGDAHTPVGHFKVYQEHTEGWEHGQLGDLYRPKYVIGGVAVHGAPNVPNYPASHGCIRVSTTFMDFVWANNVMPFGSAVWVHA